jgi:hypothetical protein
MGTDIYLHVERRVPTGWEYQGELEELEQRNYEFFAVLANVRNPIRSRERFQVIAPGRGFPPDLAPETLQRAGLLFSGHDPGWVMLRELLDFAWDEHSLVRSAIIMPAQLAPLFGDGKQRFPKDQIKGAYALANAGPGSRVTWIDSYRDAVGETYLEQLLDKLAAFGPPDGVRLLFSFDS